MEKGCGEFLGSLDALCNSVLLINCGSYAFLTVNGVSFLVPHISLKVVFSGRLFTFSSIDCSEASPGSSIAFPAVSFSFIKPSLNAFANFVTVYFRCVSPMGQLVEVPKHLEWNSGNIPMF